MQRLTCKNCRAAMLWDGVSEEIRCASCGTRFRVRPRTQAQSGITVDRGEVSPIRTTQGSFAGAALCACYVPQGWKVETNAPEEQANVLVPLTMQVTMQEPAGKCFLTYGGTQVYQHLDPTPQNAPLQGQIQHPGGYLGLCYRDALSFCDGAIQANPYIHDVQRVSQAQQPDDFVLPLLQKAVRDATAGGLVECDANWARCVYTCRDSEGRKWVKQLEAMVSLGWIPLSPQEQMMAQMLQQSQAQTAGRLAMLQARYGGAYNAMTLPMAQMPQPKLRWCLHFLIETSAEADCFQQAQALHDRVRASWKTLPALEQQSAQLGQQLQMRAMQEDQMLAGALGQMNQAQMASWDRKQGIVNDLTAHSSSVMEQIWQSNDETMQHARNRQSEMLKEVNVYQAKPAFGDDPARVEADIGWDHIYQNTKDPEVFAASVGAAPPDLGVDFEELQKLDGNY